MNLNMLCACGRPVHVGTLVYWTVGHEQTSGVVASVRTVAAVPERADVYPTLAAREAMLALTVLITGVRDGFTLAVGEYVTLSGVTPVVSGCGDTLPSLPAPVSSWAPTMPGSAHA